MTLEQQAILHLAGINIDTLEKGDKFTKDQVLLAYEKIEPNYLDRKARYERGELSSDPSTFAPAKVCEWIETCRSDMGDPVVCRSSGGGIEILTDRDAIGYCDSQAKAGLRKHKKNTNRLQKSVDATQLSESELLELRSKQRLHSFIQGYVTDAKKTLRRADRKGISLPERKDPEAPES